MCSHAALVYDCFHVVARYGREVIDRVRLDESKKQSEAGRRYIKGSRYLLLRNEENLSVSQRDRLHELLSVNEALHIVYVLKDQLKHLAHEDGIVNHARYPIHTGTLEGVHNRIKVIKRQAYGFRDNQYFILKAKAAFPGRLQPD